MHADKAHTRLDASVRAYVGLGSNLDDPSDQVHRAFEELDAIADTRVIERSALYRSPPMGPAPQPDYINAAACLETMRTPAELLQALQGIEDAHGRARVGPRWGARTLDLDLLLYADWRIETPRLIVPHPGLHERAFVLYPLREVAGNVEVPGEGELETLIRRCSPAGLLRLNQGHEQS
ncbi:MAG: 2-amino-4-hydroxy-6-hydroxymethyldihydropteridine diphosphokinase [Gammaproteobacteria bacterium]|nr:2-amino-4-hydroxy-6-hydroxymethyldihydropteridine diphosphokinase [Gammaproteobacteria bacterium]NIR97626.1 2-amino-4-hydroxy-6-hydroxymethyldihydropteridine diphosphokinase [Gammaproteobacteria bacterium]NIT63276.1 2-amino-4-hydroxy-6-hydroxymethyldihydropteridine diphosphokinase [Gammaproteobacteria bacterium]NIV20208.1 2-amino-4-hydroxy-6-hydroxymethyldihydropteridine diphosphokinase [Gammaproteobacteria bacterium]NIY31856.1 2-amino-4-hydroxy-6-hydroxymethyldihydropteridine diphosphokinas